MWAHIDFSQGVNVFVFLSQKWNVFVFIAINGFKTTIVPVNRIRGYTSDGPGQTITGDQKERTNVVECTKGGVLLKASLCTE